MQLSWHWGVSEETTTGTGAIRVQAAEFAAVIAIARKGAFLGGESCN